MPRDKDPRKCLFDILDAISLINGYLEGIEDWKEIDGNQEKIDAIERRMGVIGEALYRLKKLNLVFDE